MAEIDSQALARLVYGDGGVPAEIASASSDQAPLRVPNLDDIKVLAGHLGQHKQMSLDLVEARGLYARALELTAANGATTIYHSTQPLIPELADRAAICDVSRLVAVTPSLGNLIIRTTDRPAGFELGDPRPLPRKRLEVSWIDTVDGETFVLHRIDALDRWVSECLMRAGAPGPTLFAIDGSGRWTVEAM